MRVLDCTLRDGGYYNNWDFSEELVDCYLTEVSKSGIDYVELGLRRFPQTSYSGPFAYTTEKFLSRLNLPSGPIYGVMIDASSFNGRSLIEVKSDIDHLFCEQSDSKLGFVRVACHFHEVAQGARLAEALKRKGYLVGLNLMQAANRSHEEFEACVKVVNECRSVDVLYFADSLGCMTEKEVARIISELASLWDGELGIHTHNNMGRAIQNTLHAISCGVSWVDCTITGMGRGAGNAESELLVSELELVENRYTARPLLELAISHFEELKKIFGWGMSAPYYLGASKGIHPTYIQTLLSDPHFSRLAMFDFIDRLGTDEKAKYSGASYEKIKSAICQVDTGISGPPIPSSLFPDKVILIGGGDCIARHKRSIRGYIRDTGCKVASVNINSHIDGDLIDYLFLTKNSKYSIDRPTYKRQSCKIIMPFNRFYNNELELEFDSDCIFDYRLNVSDEFVVTQSMCETPYDVAAIYAISALVASGVNTIILLGFDGYENSRDPRHVEMSEAFEYFAEEFPRVKIISKLPTTYNIEQGSIYE